MPGLGHHDDLRVQGAGDPVALRPRVTKVGILLAITTRAGAVTSASRASAGSWLLRVVRELAGCLAAMGSTLRAVAVVDIT
jgi:hypothetical protein